MTEEKKMENKNEENTHIQTDKANLNAVRPPHTVMARGKQTNIGKTKPKKSQP